MSYVQVPADGVGKKVDTVTLTDALVEVHRQKMVVTGASGTAEVVVVTNAAPAGTDMGLVVRQAGTATIAGTVNVNGGVAISGTATVAGSVVISGTATVAGSVVISGTAQVAIGTPIVVNNISATVTVAGSVVISSTATIAGNVNISATAAVSAVIRTSGGTAVEDTVNNALRVNVVAGSSGGVSQVDGTTFSTQAANFIPIGGIFDDATPDTLSENDAGVVRMTTNRAFHVNFRDAAGAELGAASATGIFIRTATIALAADQILGSISRTVQVAVGTPFTIQGISTTVTVAGVVSLGAGTNNIGFINNISATVIVAGVVSLGAGTANIGTINDVSRTVQVAVATPFTLQGISTTVIVAVSTPFIIQGISTTVTVAGVVGLTAGTANIGSLNNISATVTTVRAGYTPAIMSTSHGPKCVTASTSANVTLITGPGAGLNIYVTQLMVGNFSTTLTKARIGTSASIGTIVQPLAASGGGFVLTFDPPWMLSASEACLCSVKPNAADAFFTVNYFVR